MDGCKGCDLFVLDHCASVTVDDCSDCRIFVGPTEAR
jgi:protein XRP2